MIRRCYRTQMEFAGVGKVWVKWYFPEGGTPLQYPTCYNSRNWRIRQGWDKGIVGEVLGAPRPWADPTPPDISCDTPRGSKDAWHGEKAPLLLCHPPADWGGGIGFDGDWPAQIADYLVAEGGGESNGEGFWGEGFTASGGAESDGVGSWGLGWIATGGGESGGAGLWHTGWLAEGGGESTGVGDWADGFTGAGGGQGNGAGTWGIGWRATGGSESGGVGLWGLGWLATGGGESNGAGTWTEGFSGSGGGESDGTGTFDSGGDVFPPGVIVGYGNTSAPSGWLLCDGSAVSRSTYATLFGIIGTSFGVGDGSTTFNVPDLRGRSMLGNGTGSGLSTRVLGASGGEENHTMTVSELVAHTHAQDGNTVLAAGPGGNGTNPFGASALGGTTQSRGSTSPFNVMHPYQVVVMIIKT